MKVVKMKYYTQKFFSTYQYKLLNISFLVLCGTQLIACSPHPGTGNWVNTSNDKPFKKLVVHYDGKAELYQHISESQNKEWRCFWSGKTKNEIEFNCTAASDPDTEHSFRLSVDQDNRNSRLFKGSVQLGIFNKQEYQSSPQ